MFKNKSFNLSGFLSKPPKQDSRISHIIEPTDYEKEQEKSSKALKEQNQHLKSQISRVNSQICQVSSQLEKIKQLFIETRIQHDAEIRTYDELIEQLRNQIQEKNSLLKKYVITLRNDLQNQKIIEVTEEDQNIVDIAEEDEKQNYPQNQVEYEQYIPTKHKNIQTRYHEKKQISELLNQSKIDIEEKYQASLQQIQHLKSQCERLKHQLNLSADKNNPNFSMKNDVSYTGNGDLRTSLNFGDFSTELKDVEEIAQFPYLHSRASGDQEITVREERIQNLERQNLELQHQLASKSHKIARIFNAAFQFGGMNLLDCLQSSIGLVENQQNRE